LISKEVENNKFDFSHPPGEFESQDDKIDYYSKLNYLDLRPDTDTDKLIKHITKRKVERGIRIYRITKDIEQNAQPITEEMLKDAAKKLEYRSDQLLAILLIKPDQKTKSRIQHGLLLAEKKHNIVTMKETAVKNAARVLKIEPNRLLEMLNNDINREIEPNHFNNPENDPEEKTMQKHQRANFPLNILIYFLAETLKAIEGKPCYPIINGFLTEQGIIMEGLEDSSIERRYERYTPEKFETIYNFYRDIYYPSLGYLIDVNYFFP
jgi:hypothetical protein